MKDSSLRMLCPATGNGLILMVDFTQDIGKITKRMATVFFSGTMEINMRVIL